MWSKRKSFDNNKRHQFGLMAEKKAVRFLKKKGHRIIQCNYRTPIGEIDIISLQDKTLVFTEVRSRNAQHLVNPEETIDDVKQKKIRRTAEHYLLRVNNPLPECRFDVIAIIQEENGEWKLRYYENAF